MYSNSLSLTADWSAAIDAQQLLEPWPDAYPPESTPPEPTPTLTYLQNLPALSNKEQVTPDVCAAKAAR